MITVIIFVLYSLFPSRFGFLFFAFASVSRLQAIYYELICVVLHTFEIGNTLYSTAIWKRPLNPIETNGEQANILGCIVYIRI